MATRTPAERDAVTVETGYACVTGALLGLAVFLLLAAPVLVWPMPAFWLTAAGWAGGAVFCARVVRVLRR
ncbi:hypothetical protein JJV70_08225 [Streptomyces sp. JJ66]|uniref:DUF6332 family protein n=1 Tax=Streptomyces sp. JJ66 TaxID=2803843 RepID=UPI001C59B0BC|nr:DUF6332 family protein [Streptomyces sp. JJ66]MBW1602099.1 hypothetical protein [Streptomyces sp. JJ66]